jgi:antirestriction protein ArdC
LAPHLVKSTTEVRRENNAEQSLPLIGGIARDSRAGMAFLHIIANSRLLEVLRDDDRAIVRAASAASKAADYLLAFRLDSNEPVEVAQASDNLLVSDSQAMCGA